jgi:hypothetical protein
MAFGEKQVSPQAAKAEAEKAVSIVKARVSNYANAQSC